jgi:hypothetical protein
MSQSLRRLAKIEEALSKLLKKEDAVVVWHHKVETEEECLNAAIRAGRYDKNTQNLILVISNIEIDTKARYGEWTSELPKANRNLPAEVADEIARTSPAPRFEGTYPEPPEEPREERRTRINYPDSGIV